LLLRLDAANFFIFKIYNMPNNSIFDFADKFGYSSPFGEDWIATERGAREERERLSKQNNAKKVHIVPSEPGFYIAGADKECLKIAEADLLAMFSPTERQRTNNQNIYIQLDIRKLQGYEDKLIRKVIIHIPDNAPHTQCHDLLKNLSFSNERYLYYVGEEAYEWDEVLPAGAVQKTVNGEYVREYKKSEVRKLERKQHGLTNVSRTERNISYFDTQQIGSNAPRINFKKYKDIIKINTATAVEKQRKQQLLNTFKTTVLNKTHSLEGFIIGDLPDLDFDAILSIHPYAEWFYQTMLGNDGSDRRNVGKKEYILRVDVVFHELWESWERTTQREPYAWSKPFATNVNFQISDYLWDYSIEGAHQKAENAAAADYLQFKTSQGRIKNYVRSVGGIAPSAINKTTNHSLSNEILKQIQENKWDRSNPQPQMGNVRY
jgi:hypothetical protein